MHGAAAPARALRERVRGRRPTARAGRVVGARALGLRCPPGAGQRGRAGGAAAARRRAGPGRRRGARRAARARAREAPAPSAGALRAAGGGLVTTVTPLRALALLLALPLTALAHPLAPALLDVEELAGGRAVVTWKQPALRVPGARA